MSATQTTDPELIQTRDGSTLVLTLNRIAKHHALNSALCEQLVSAIEAANSDADLRVIVITGAGARAFCAGQDMLEASGVSGSAPKMAAAHAVAAVSSTPLPVIAAINGYCFGGGAQLALACDILLASDTATFRLPGAEYGLVVAASTLPRLVGASKAKELILAGRRFTAQQALRWGMLSDVFSPTELLPAAAQMAAEIGANSVAAVRASKRVINAATLSAEAIDIEAAANRELRGSPEQSARFRDATRNVTGR